jgi:hypothetical protein
MACAAGCEGEPELSASEALIGLGSLMSGWVADSINARAGTAFVGSRIRAGKMTTDV